MRRQWWRGSGARPVNNTSVAEGPARKAALALRSQMKSRLTYVMTPDEAALVETKPSSMDWVKYYDRLMTINNIRETERVVYNRNLGLPDE